MSYEKNKEMLEEIVAKLNSGKVSVKESLALYKKGIELTGLCLQEMNGLKLQLTVLNADMEKLEALQSENDGSDEYGVDDDDD